MTPTVNIFIFRTDSDSSICILFTVLHWFRQIVQHEEIDIGCMIINELRYSFYSICPSRQFGTVPQKRRIIEMC